ncbi:MAG: DNA/RNA non-specific endonuclease [Candidatus Cryptobacteroides sp.]
MDSHIAATIASCTSSSEGYDGTFTATISGLTPGQTYVFQSYATVAGTGTYESQSRDFWAPSYSWFSMPGGGLEPAVDKDWLELPSGLDGSQYVVNTYYFGERNYTHLYDTSMMTSLWTAYPLNSTHMGSLSRPSSWYYSPSIDQSYQADLTSHSYSDDTYSRGHMCPNGSRNGNETMQKQTFYVTNQVPQIQNSFNGGIWSSLESAVQSLAGSEEIYVVTGVAFNKEGETLTTNYVSPTDNSSQKCPIPNYFYKLVLRVKYSGSTVSDARAIGFWMEHKAYSGDSYLNYTVSVDQIEQWTGFDFFVNLPDAIESAAESAIQSWSDFIAW